MFAVFAVFCFSSIRDGFSTCTYRGGAVTAAALVGTLEGLGVGLSVTPLGKLRAEPASLIPGELLEELRLLKAEVVALLLSASSAGEANRTPQRPQTPPMLSGAHRNLRCSILETPQQTPQNAVRPGSALPSDPLVIGQQPGRCGSCARWSPGPWVPYMGGCSAGWAAHGLPYGTPPGPVEIQAGHGCVAYRGRGWLVRSTP